MHNSTKFNINGNPTDDEAVISNPFNNYFIYVGPRLAQQIQSHSNPLNYNNNKIYLKSNIQCTYRYEFSGLYNNNIQLQ